ncbi:hypothetical protein KIN20_014430 [Parelaphostrongylus tenuis]|uniref:Uncharacterized protein n=1 Tax=Parelaphostrongylus tenuis TaxID=148309 RepID=A0AAD5MEY6_PARTN|nr:hypothetical protein KIN20_014430 [Parelaphostrongylus tenuis]
MGRKAAVTTYNIDNAIGPGTANELTVRRFFVNYTKCDALEAVAVAVEFMKKKNVDAVIASPCPARK